MPRIMPRIMPRAMPRIMPREMPRAMQRTAATRHATRRAMQECDYWREAESTRRFKLMLAKYPEFAVPAVVPQLSTEHVLTTEWMPGVPIDRAGKGEAARSNASAWQRWSSDLLRPEAPSRPSGLRGRALGPLEPRGAALDLLRGAAPSRQSRCV